MQVKNAEDRGAIGVILYSDPEQVTRPGQGVYPESIYLPDWAAQRGSVARSIQGDPLTPGIPSVGKTSDIERQTNNTMTLTGVEFNFQIPFQIPF